MSSSVTVSAICDTETPGGTSGVPVTSAACGPSLAPVRVAITCTSYSVSLVRLPIVVEPEVTVACRSPVL